MKVEIRERDRRALGLLALAVALYLVASWLVLPSYDRLKLAPAVAAEKEDQLRKYRRVLLRKDRYVQLIPTAKRQVAAAETVLLRGDNLSLATAELQSLLEDIAKRSDVTIAQRTVLSARKIDEFYNELPVSMAFDATPAQLVNLLTNVRMAPKFLTVRSVQVTAVQPITEAPKSGEHRKLLHVNLTIAAILEPAEKAG